MSPCPDGTRPENTWLLGGNGFAKPHEFPEFRFAVETIEIGVPGGPIQVAVPSANRLFEGGNRFGFFEENTIGAGCVV